MRIDFDRFLVFTALLASGTVMGACSSSSSGGGAIPCDDAGTCPSGLLCSGGVCVAGSSGGSGGGSGGLPSGGSGGVPSGGTAGVATGGGPSGGAAGSTGGGPPVGGGGGGTSCDPAPGTPGSCTADDPANTCQTCIEADCCSEYGACTQTPNDNCAWGGPSGEGEVFCFQDCLFTAGVADASTQAACAASCTTAGCNTISTASNDLIACLNAFCFSECLQL